MNKTIKTALCLVMAAALSGCSSQDVDSGSSITIIDAGGASVITTTTGDNAYSSELSSGEFFDTSDIVIPTDTTVATQNTTESTVEATTDNNEDDIDTSEPTESTPYIGYDTPGEITATEVTTTAETTVTTVETTVTTTTVTTVQTTTASESTTEQTDVDIPSENIGSYGTNTYQAVNYSEVKAVWISYLELIDLLQGKSRDTFVANISEVYDNCVSLGINTVYVHARSHGDAYYESELFPYSKYASGEINCSPGFDPLAIMINEAHERGLSFHAWINPLRACSVSDMADYGSYPIGMWHNDAATSDKYVVAVGSYYYLNPAYDAVTQLIADGAAEIVSAYDVDGLHIDDYFYPTTDSSFDSSAFSASDATSLSDFRYNNCDRLVAALYDAVKTANPSALFSVSCQGSVENNYNLMYADVKKWCAEDGYLDYIAPQIYYGFDNSTQPYVTCLNEWDAIAQKGGIPLVVGLSVSKVGYEDVWAGAGKNEWINDSTILARQTTEAKSTRSYGGIALYSYRSIFSPVAEVKEQINKEIDSLKEVL